MNGAFVVDLAATVGKKNSRLLGDLILAETAAVRMLRRRKGHLRSRRRLILRLLRCCHQLHAKVDLHTSSRNCC